MWSQTNVDLWGGGGGDKKGFTFSLLHFPVYVCTLSEEVLHERLGNWTKMDGHPATAAAALQR